MQEHLKPTPENINKDKLPQIEKEFSFEFLSPDVSPISNFMTEYSIKVHEQLEENIAGTITQIALENGIKYEYAINKSFIVDALKNRMAENHFQNECKCIVDYELLYKAIDRKCKSENCYFRNKYRIVLRNSYPAVCINRQWLYVHVLIGEFMSGRIRKGYVVHHKDKNKLNAMPYNLEIMTKLKHLKDHSKERIGIDFRSAKGKSNSLISANEARTRKDVTKEKVAELRNKCLTIPEIAKELNCGINTVNRRLGMKDY